MKKDKPDLDKQIKYLGKWVNREHFRVFVYNAEGQTLAKNAEEYESLIHSGLWFDSVENIPKVSVKIRKSKHGITDSDSQGIHL